jgi:hypothetical protein
MRPGRSPETDPPMPSGLSQAADRPLRRNGKSRLVEEPGEPDRVPLRRDTLTGRTIRRGISLRLVPNAVGPITKGCEIFGCTKGDWSLVDLIEYVLGFTGPAHVDLATWTMGGNDTFFAHGLLDSGRILSMRFLVDFSFPRCQPSYAAALRQRFGDNSIRLSKCHAKFVVIRNEEWSVCIRTSMNLNENKRLEFYEISDSQPMAEWLVSLMDSLFARTTTEETWSRGPGEHVTDFENEWTDQDEGERDPAARGDYFGEGPVDVDIRRIGVTRR